MLEFYKARGFDVKIIQDIPHIAIDNPCPHLDLEKGCRIYATRPKWCRLYDGRFDPFVRDKCLWNK